MNVCVCNVDVWHYILMLMNAMSIVIEKTKLPKHFLWLMPYFYSKNLSSSSRKHRVIYGCARWATHLHICRCLFFMNMRNNWSDIEIRHFVWRWETSWFWRLPLCRQYINVSSVYEPSKYLDIVLQIYTQGIIFSILLMEKKKYLYSFDIFPVEWNGTYMVPPGECEFNFL